LTSGEVVAALTDGADSPVCGKIRVQTYPVEERAGIVWVYVGDEAPPPIERDIPEELLHPDAVVLGRFTVRDGDWRHAAENGFDEGHAKYLHRSSFFLFFRRVPAWSRTHVVTDPRGGWITRVQDQVGFETVYPGLGRWPRFRIWNRRGRGPSTSIRLPGALRVHYGTWIDFEWYVAVQVGTHRYVQLAVTHARGVRAFLFRLRYWVYLRPIFHGRFNDQDTWMVRLMRTPPERLYRPDVSIIAWRKLGEYARGAASAAGAPAEAMPVTREDEVPEETRA
jgi:phenylpropionate dioxygenase-like ring-hydroxylating dioxygenase large terminal subunit